MSPLEKILTAFEVHDPQAIRDSLSQGIDVNSTVNGAPLVYSLINMYTRGPKFTACMQVMVDHGLIFDDSVLLAVLLNDALTLQRLVENDPAIVNRRYTLACTFTPLMDATLLHICAEYNHVDCAEVLVEAGADVNARAGGDGNGFGGQTPIFHTVNQDANKCVDMLRFLLVHGADAKLMVTGLIWGRGYEWETFIPAVNPVSYAMMGLLRQFQRTEENVYAVVGLLMQTGFGIVYKPANVPNRYLSA